MREKFKYGDVVVIPKALQTVYITIIFALFILMAVAFYMFFAQTNKISQIEKKHLQIEAQLKDEIKYLNGVIANLKDTETDLRYTIAAQENEIQELQLSTKERVDSIAEILSSHNKNLKGKATLIAMAYDVVSKYTGVETEILTGIGKVESNYVQNAVSYAGATGIQQIMPKTMASVMKNLNIDDYKIDDIITNIYASAVFYRDLRRNSNTTQALVYYNEGGAWSTLAERTSRHLENSRSYVSTVMRYKDRHGKLIKE